ncbi:Zinc finger, RING-type [Dillenia turbinata]|uniref:RING-type E3 ubiquitin transferase n=1 Tax=Dillenia turbinata TaxID=194707 RepID=A0AAN8ZQS0_9MAGN
MDSQDPYSKRTTWHRIHRMGQRTVSCSSQLTDLGMSQPGEGHLHPEPCMFLGSAANYPQPNIYSPFPASSNAANHGFHQLPENHINAIFYGMPPYNGVQQRHPSANLNLGVGIPPNFYDPYMAVPSGAGVFPLPPNHVSSCQLPPSSNYGVIGLSADEYGRNNQFMDGFRGSCKRKNFEGVPGYSHQLTAAGSSTSSVAPINTRHFEAGVTAVMASTPFPVPQYRGMGNPSNMEAGSHRSVRNRSGATGLDPFPAHNHNYMVQGNYGGHSLQPVGSPRLDQQLSCNRGAGGTLVWSQAPAIPYIHESNFNGASMDIRTSGVDGYHDASGNRSSTDLLPPFPVNQQHNLNHPSMQGLGGHNVNFIPQTQASLRRHPATNSFRHGPGNPSQDMEMGLRHPGPVPSGGLRMYQPHRQGVIPERTLRHHNIAHFRVLPTDEIAILEIPGFYDVGNGIDHHQDMRLDIDDMSYEDLLALAERIGNVSTGLSEDTILTHLRTKIYDSSIKSINLEEMGCAEQETDSCIICLEDFANQDKVAILDCGHEYHADCLKKWLLVKNVCPICKSSATATEGKDA